MGPRNAVGVFNTSAGTGILWESEPDIRMARQYTDSGLA